MPPSEAPTPILPKGAGGPPRRAAGWVCRTPALAVPSGRPPGPEAPWAPTPIVTGGLAVVIEADPLLRLHAASAARGLGFAPLTDEALGHGAPAVVFLGLDSVGVCSRCASAARRHVAGGRPTPASAALVVGYATSGGELLAAHRLHACCDLTLGLRAVAGRPCFVHLPGGGFVEQADLTRREADVLVLVLGGLTTAALAERLSISPATARTHCRALLRKLGFADRRALRARLLDPEPDAPLAARGCAGGA
jgi:DNA-binding CsgD family transcriptional regulator